jgi:hypothetical protein
MSQEDKGFAVNIDDYEHPTALVEFDADGWQNEILLVIDWANRSITVETRAQFDYTDDAWLRDRTDIYDLPQNVDATELRMWVEEEVVPRAQPLAEAFALVTRNGKQWGEFPKMEDERRRFHVWMAIHAEPPTYDWEQWEVADYLPDLPETMSTISDEVIELLVDRALEYAAAEGVVFIGGREAVREFLVASRERLRERGRERTRSPW